MSASNVTVFPMDVPIRPWFPANYATSSADLLRDACRSEFNVCERVIQSSFDQIAAENISPSHNGFVNAAIAAYGQHHHLTIRPEDVWFSILVQLSFYINAHAEQLRTTFVSHQDKKPLRVDEVGTLDTVDLGRMAVKMTAEMQKYIVDPDLREWILPNFTTTTTNDVIVAAVLMMGAMQEYFAYTFGIICGLPSVTLLGEKQDWIDIRRRVDRIGRLGDEPAQFSSLLKPVLDHFILSLEDPKSPAVIDFWSRIAHRAEPYCGAEFLSGWITSFCFWKSNGELLYKPRNSTDRFHDNGVEAFNVAKGAADVDWEMFHTIDFQDIPDGFASVPVLIDNHGVEIKSRMVAGSVGIKVWSSEKPMNPPSLETGDDSIQPVSGWWMYKFLEGKSKSQLEDEQMQKKLDTLLKKYKSDGQKVLENEEVAY